MRFNAHICGLIPGVLGGGGLFLATLTLLLWGGDSLGPIPTADLVQRLTEEAEQRR